MKRMEAVLAILFLAACAACFVIFQAWKNARLKQDYLTAAAHHAIYYVMYPEAPRIERSLNLSGFLQHSNITDNLENTRIVCDMAEQFVKNTTEAHEGYISFLRMNKELDDMEKDE
ncbi:hypothetical protein [uncultured Selenomonas sp.]|uniref:hypothetical protein n=1 Tax=uncultured Selenomonas sp. TaxID=159275 RepID=UPI0026770F0F|nr:hypothetical protein [uncultured Selenomonas sp.]